MNNSQTMGFIALAIGLAACAPDLPAGSRVTKLRTLALAADPAFAHPGESVELRLLAADPEGRTLSFALALCSDPAGSTVADCIESLDRPFEPLELADDRFRVDIPGDFLRGVPEAGRASAYLGAVVVACPGAIERGETSGVPVVCRDAEGARLPISEFEVGVKRVYVRERDRNQNPAITRVLWDGDDWPESEVREARACANDATDDIEDCPAALRHRIRVETSDPEAGRDELGLAFEERQIVQFYATEGVFERAVRIAEEPDNQWAAQRARAEALTRFWFVVRDDRGGVSWTERQVRVR